MYPIIILFSVLALLACVADAATQTRPTDVAAAAIHPAIVVEKIFTNAQRLALGMAPASPAVFASLRSGARYSRLRRDDAPPAPSTTPTPPPPVCVITTNAIPLWDSSQNIDDQYKQVDLPVPLTVQMYDQNSTAVFVSTNGIYSLLSGTSAYSNSGLPLSNPDFPAYAVFPLWDDTYIYAGTNQRIYYSIINNNGPVGIVVEYLFSHYQAPTEYYHYTVEYSIARPGVFLVKYYDVSDSGSSSTVGAQGMHNGAVIFTQYSYNQFVITPGLALTIDTLGNTITAGTFDVNVTDILCASQS
ncbi:hypothetical protein C8J57DRAFT_1146274 [Mycena rebaudengoi]|nr:hypothetical protein C8J57DRAFT_1146274 [Mycena rebaudengoi]